MSLLPRTTLHSDSEQFIYNLDAGRRPGPGLRKLKEAQRMRGKADKSRVKYSRKTIIGMYLCPGSRAEKQKRQGGK